MADLFTHIATVFIILKLLSWKTEFIEDKLIPVGMIGAIIPDLSRLEIIIPSPIIEQLGIHYTWFGLHTLVGATITSIILTLFFEKQHRTKVLILLVFGVISHLTLDFFLISPSPEQYAILYPLAWEPPTIGIYLSTDKIPAILTGTAATTIILIEKTRKNKRQ
ncbi:metal-dependent hydrolase [Methanonatronarchaeum sp. AMET-Sl]|uniref:metal-dependent hydrolase n=1 Tax=Methanonatronarchaeum sp. AMET-Sl TaxID=3037654 RepID=UPI00244E32E8|nr:metal-dependent hydrolase [Methanonatronarchaeum sp. AMET-Sl]WGI18174.1 metal-dependent hydrolase [Methanonatronarchaeum sp. AMET-Sl]